MNTMITKELIKQIINEAKHTNKFQKEVCVSYNITPKMLSYFKKKFNLSVSKGTHPNSRTKRKSSINDEFFSCPNMTNCYWAGFIAADGNITKNILTITLALKDEIILLEFLKVTNSSYKIHYGKSKGFPTCTIKIVSDKICEDLKNNFNITPNKSLTFNPPKLHNELKDLFILGYIDGDGSIGLYKRQKGFRLQISILGTNNMCNYINIRFKEILNKSCNTNVQFKKSSNIYIISYANKNARCIFKHFFNLNHFKLKRKWDTDFNNHCDTFKKFENIEMYNKILSLDLDGYLNKDISTKLGISEQLIYYYKNRNTYKNLKLTMETKQLDSGEIDLESSN